MLIFLALAIVQAVVFINKNNSSLSGYISMYRDSEKDAIYLLSKEFEDQGRYRDTENPVATTWYISFNQAMKQDMLAAEYLFLMAFTTGEHIPASLLRLDSTEVATREAIGTLDAYAFATERPQDQRQKEGQYQGRTFDMHRLVRLATREWLRKHNVWEIWGEKAARLMKDVISDSYGKRELWSAYLPHFIHIVGLSEVYEVAVGISLLDYVGWCELQLGRYKAAELAYRQTLELTEKLLGKEHPNTLHSVNNLAIVLVRQGKYAEAEVMQQEALVLRQKVLGKEHPETLASLNNLAWILGSLGKYAEAEVMQREALPLQEKVLGKEHRMTVRGVYCIANMLFYQHQYEDALCLCKQAYTGFRNTLGPDHPDTQRCLGSYTKVKERSEEQALANERHEHKTLQSELTHSDLQSPNVVELILRPKDRWRQKLRKWTIRRERPVQLGQTTSQESLQIPTPSMPCC